MDDNYVAHKLTIDAVDSVRRSGNGRDARSTEARIAYVRSALAVGLVEEKCRWRAVRTIKNLQEQL